MKQNTNVLIPISDREQRKEPSNTQKLIGAETASNTQRNRRRSNTFEYFSHGLDTDKTDQLGFRKELERATERKRQSKEKKNYIFKKGDKDYQIIYKASKGDEAVSHTKVKIIQTLFGGVNI